jgi:glucose-1-phosphatase
MIEAVVFDFGNVIARFDNQIPLRHIAERTGRTIQHLEHALYHRSNIMRLFETGATSSTDFYRRLSREAELPMPEADFRAIYTNKFFPIQTTIKLIARLKPRYRLGLLSNTSPWDFEDVIRKTAVYPLFDAVTLSYEVGVMKPSPLIYQDMVMKLGVTPDACAYIDDIGEFSEGASLLGMKGIHYTSHDELVVAMRRLGILI